MPVRSGMDARLAGGVFLVVPADPTSSAHRRSRAAGPGTGTGRSSVRRAGRRTGSLQDGVRPARSRPVRDPGTTASSLPDTGRTCGPPRRRIRPTGATAPRRSCLPGGSARCTEQPAVGRGEMRTAEKSVGGRRSTVGGGAGECVQLGKSSATESTVTVTRGRRSDRSRRARAVRRTASSGWVPWSRCVQVGARGARQGGGRGEPRARMGVGSPRARASPVAVGKDRAGLWEDRGGRCGQPVG